jgi:thymidylate kinase
MKPIVILEGPDGAGKSTLAKAIAKRLKAVTSHHGAYEGLPGDELARLYYQTLLPALSGVAPVVLDRAWHSEPIYGPIFRREDRMLTAWRRMLDRCLLTVPHLVVLLLPPMDLLWETIAPRLAEELPQKRMQLAEIYDRYALGSARWAGDLTVFHGARPDLQQAAESIHRDLRAEAYPVELYRRGVIGSLRHRYQPSALLVGDQASAASTTNLPFVSFRRDGCSAWFTDRLEEHGIPEDRLLWINAYRPSGEPVELARVVELAQVPAKLVIALGERAHEVLAKQKVEHATFSHPQHVKRFHHRQGHRWDLLAYLDKELLS